MNKFLARLKKKKSIELFIAACIILIIGGISAVTFIKNKQDPVVAEVNNVKIRKSELTKKLTEVFRGDDVSKVPDISAMPSEVLEVLSKQVYLEKSIDRKAKRSKAARSKATNEKIDEAKRIIVRTAFLEGMVKDEVTDEMVNQKYAELTDKVRGKKEYLVSIVLVKDKKLADDLTRKLSGKNYADFLQLAKKYTINPALLNEQNNYLIEDIIEPTVVAKLNTSKKGSVVGPVKTTQGWYIIKYGDAREVDMANFTDAKNQTRKQLEKEALNKYILKLTDKVKIKILLKSEQDKNVKSQTVEGQKITDQKSKQLK